MSDYRRRLLAGEQPTEVPRRRQCCDVSRVDRGWMTAQEVELYDDNVGDTTTTGGSATGPSNKGMKLTKPERNGALQLIPGVGRTRRVA